MGLFSPPDMTAQKHRSFLSAFTLVLFATAVVFVFYKSYYTIFPWILSKNIVYPDGTLTPWMQAWARERDGIEIYVLYGVMFLNMAALMGLTMISRHLHNKWVDIVLIVGACWIVHKYSFGSGIVFTAPPAELMARKNIKFMYCSLFALLLLSAIFLQKKISHSVETVLVASILVPFCFVATSPIAITNYAYIFAPAQKLLEGVSVSEIYFQYDFFWRGWRRYG